MHHLSVSPLTGSPPTPPLVPEQQFWSQHPPATSQHRTRCQDTPESEPAACRSLCASVSEVFVQVQFGEVVLQMDSEVHVLHRMNHDINELHTRHLPTVTMTRREFFRVRRLGSVLERVTRVEL